MRKLALLAAASIAAMGISTAASAQLADNGDGTYTITGAGTGGTAVINFDGNSGGAFIPGLTGQLSLTYTGLVGTDYGFSYILNNTSSITSRISGFAFDVDPNASGGTASGLFSDVIVGGAFPNGVGDVDVCLNNNGESCQGGGGTGVLNGDSGNGTFTLDFGASAPTSITLSDFFVRYQSLQVGTGSGTGSQVPGVPEPATWAMMLMGFGATGVAMRRRRRKLAFAQFA